MLVAIVAPSIEPGLTEVEAASSEASTVPAWIIKGDFQQTLALNGIKSNDSVHRQRSYENSDPESVIRKVALEASASGAVTLRVETPYVLYGRLQQAILDAGLPPPCASYRLTGQMLFTDLRSAEELEAALSVIQRVCDLKDIADDIKTSFHLKPLDPRQIPIPDAVIQSAFSDASLTANISRLAAAVVAARAASSTISDDTSAKQLPKCGFFTPVVYADDMKPNPACSSGDDKSHSLVFKDF